jgi:acyl transferase domain-containing protein/2-polyprenyl-3-methyl-5-hydroxy-6-metoxy-1,4-benzoquinol methylase/acyl carrier protein
MDNSDSYENTHEESIAIIGMSGRFPGAKNIDEFWQNLKAGVESISFFSDQELLASGIDPAILKNSNYVKAKGVLDNVAEFDAAFFGFSPKEAEITDPQQRLFLECAWEALENAGYDPKTYSGSIGVYGGVNSISAYLLQNLYTNQEIKETGDYFQISMHNSNDFVCTRVSYKLDLSGPSITVQTACSTSLVAVAMGYQSLLDYQCDIVLAGGASITLPQKSGHLYQEGMIMSPDGHCRAFDAKARGTVNGNGVGIVVLKRLTDALADGDHICAVIRSVAINNDGASKISYAAPSLDAQTRAIAQTLTFAEISPETISYVETHGTGTSLGDLIEIGALTQAFRAQTDKKGYCALGSVKTNIGHLDTAAGISGLIKTVLALEHQLIPPSLHFETPNPKLDLDNSPFYVNTKLSEWKTTKTPRRAGVNSFGMGGTNAHVILEEAPNKKSKINDQKSKCPWQLLLLSAKTDTALKTATTQLVEHLKQHLDLNLADVAYTYQIGRCAFNQRRILVCQTLEDVIKTLETRDTKRVFTKTVKGDKNPSVVFMFSGQGAQYINMGLELYQTESVFREQIDHCAEFLKPHLGLDLRTVLYPHKKQQTEVATQKLKQTAITQPVLFVIEYALAQLWKTWGIQPKAMIGHSIGEYVAACLAGVFSLEEALILVAARGRLIQSVPAGAMLAVPLAEAEIRPLLNQNLDLAAINVPFQSVVSGTFEAVEQLTTQLAEQGIECQRLHTSHAFHSEMMSPILTSFFEQMQKIHLKPPQIPFVSNVTGTWISNTEAIDPNYWVKHLRQTVRFTAGLQQILQESSYILLEIGPGHTLSTFAKRHPDNAGLLVSTSLRHPKDEQSDSAFLLNTLGQLWMAGITVNWSEFHADERRYRLPLPTYPFERQRYWIEVQKPIIEDKQFQLKSTTSQLWKLLIEVIQKQAQQAQQDFVEFDNPTRMVEKSQSLNRLCAAYVNLALRELGAFSNPAQQYSSDELLHQCHILPFYRQLVPRCLIALVEQGHLQQQGEKFTLLIPFSRDDLDAIIKETKARWTKMSEVLERIQLYGDRFANILIGKENPRELLFTGATFDTLQHLYKNTPESRYFGTIEQAGIKQILKSLPSGIKLRILEIGAGTGGNTVHLLPELSPQRTHYVFTDVSLFFINQAKQKFSEYPYIEYCLLDIEKNPTEQDFENHSFDIVVAVQVLHVAKNLGQALEHVRSLLAPEGLLILGEITSQDSLSFDVSFPILQPFEKSDELRRSYYPFLTTKQWHEALQKYGFVEVKSFPHQTDAYAHLFIAKASPIGILPAFSVFTEKVQMETVHALEKKQDIADWFYIPSWKHSILPNSSKKQAISQQCWLVFVDEYGLGVKIVKRLEQEGQDVVSVKVGHAFSSIINDHTYTLNPQHCEDYDALLKVLHTLNKIPTTIVHLWNIIPQDDIKSDVEQLKKYQNLGFYSLLFLAQVFGTQNVTGTIQMNVVSNNLQKVTGEEKLCPEKATLLGPCRVIPQEYPNITCRSIDIVLPDSGTEKILIDQLLSEFLFESSDLMVAYRDSHRWVSTIEAVRLEKNSGTSRLRKKGVYLITGGLGGIGLTLAEYLAKTVQAKLILTMRSAFPARNEWQQWLTTHNEQDSISRKIQKVQTIEALGSEVLIINADVTNVKQMQTAITQSLKLFEHIHGVIHTAGIPGGGIIQLKTRKIAESIFAPKVIGTRILNAIFKDVQLDFLVLCSSLNSILGGLAQVDYCAANAFLDAFAHYKATQKGLLMTMSIGWETWQEVGMAVEATKQHAGETPGETPTTNTNVVDLNKGLSPAEGMEVFDRILQSKEPQVFVSMWDLQARLKKDTTSTILAPLKESTPKSAFSRSQLNNAYVVPRNELERTITETWEKFFGIEGVGIFDDFFELGGDSLVAVQLISELRRTTQLELSVHSLLENPTISALAESIQPTPVDDI